MLALWCLLATAILVAVKASPVVSNSSFRALDQDEVIDEIKAMKKRLTANENTIAADKKIITENAKTILENQGTIRQLKQRLDTYAQQCSLEANDACGPCVCKEDRRLRKKYFCDCSLLGPRRDCLEFYQEGHHVDGLYIIKQLQKTFQVFCDQSTDGGGWTMIQRRNGDASVNFYRNWEDYKKGFGDLQHEFWLGNEYLHLLSLAGQCFGANDLRIEMQKTSDSDKMYYAKYDHFAVNSEFHKYRLALGKYSGDLSDYFTYHNAMKFSTYDQDNDASSNNCAITEGKGGWWYNSCVYSNLNGRYFFYGDKKLSPDNIVDGIYWAGNQLKFVEMKLRRNKEGNCSAREY